RLHLPRRAIGRRGESRVPETAASAARDEHALIRVREICQESVGLIGVAGFFVHEGADRHFQLEIASGVTGAIGAFAVLAARGRAAPPRFLPAGHPDAAAASGTPAPRAGRRRSIKRLDADDAAVRAVVLELHAARDLREDRVVLAEAGVEARTESTSALADD